MNRGMELLLAMAADASTVRYDEHVEEGECRYCGCTHDRACQLDDEPFACSWYRKPDHRGLGVCSAPACVKKYLADTGAP